LAVAESGTLSKASSVLGIAQPALSRAIRQLEESLQVQVFYRHGRGIKLTEKGAQYRAMVDPLVSNILRASDEIKSSAGVPAGSIAFGMPPSMSALVGARLVEAFLELYPHVQLQIIDAFSGYVNEWLVAGRLDLAIINSARRSAHFSMDPLLTVDLFHVARRNKPDSPARSNSTIAFDELLDMPLMLPGRHHGLRRQLDAVAQGRGAKLNVIVEIDALEALKELVQRGVASTVLPHGAIFKNIDNSQFVIRRILEPDVTMQFMIAYSLQRPTTLAMRELVRILRMEVHQAVVDGRMMGRVGAEL
jgi:LysR family nitrogen assimilation transcriptional regulator